MKSAFLRPLLFCVALLPMQAFATAKPPELAASIHAAAPVGEGSLHKFMIHAYDASFWSDAGEKPPYAISLTYALDFDAQELADRSFDEMRRVSDLPEATLRGYADRLAKLWPDVNENDRLTALALRDGSTVFYYNGRKLGAIADPKFTTAFFAIWLSPRTSEPALRKALLHVNADSARD